MIWKRTRRGELNGEQAAEVLSLLLGVPILTRPCSDLLANAMDLAIRLDRSVYDSLYVAMAVGEGVPLLTADRRLVNALAGGPLAGHVRWIGEPQ